MNILNAVNMSEITIYLLLISLLAGFWLWELWLSRKKLFRKRTSDATVSDNRVTASNIGEIRYNEMSLNLSSLLKRHADDGFITLTLCPADLTSDCRRVLHDLVPGDRLCLCREISGGCVGFSVFHTGRLVGIISRSDSAKVDEIMKESVITGVYVWRQNCFGECDFTDLDVVLFYNARVISPCSNYMSPYKLEFDGVHPFTLYQN